MDNRKILNELKGFQGRLILMREENRKYHEKKDKEIIELSEDLGVLIKTIEDGGSGTGTQNNQLLTTAKRKATESIQNLIPLGNGNVKRDRTDLAEDDNGYTIVHTDGACSDNGKKGARAGVGIYWGDGSPHNIGEPVKGERHTNNTAEIQAATFAVAQARGLGITKLNIHTDSQFLINCMTKWIHGWKRNKWMTASKKPVINREDLEALETEINRGNITVKYTYVAGHAGIKGNEEADRLARTGAEKR